MQETIFEIVRRAEQNLLSGTVKLGEHVDWSLHDTVERIFAYLNSKHITGDKDSLGRDKPFFNIVTAAVNIWYRATDLDRKDIIVLPNSSTTVTAAFLATVLLQEWMKKASFGVFLNQWGRTLAQYGSAIVKFVEKDGTLYPSVTPWSRAIVDSIDFNALPKIEKFFKTPSQLRNMATVGHPDYVGYNLEAVKSLEDSKTTRTNLRDEQIDLQSDFIELYEVHGLLSAATYKLAKGEKVKDGDDEKYFQQMHVISFYKDDKGEYKDLTVYSGKEKKDPTMITHLIEEDGRVMAIGAVEYLFDAQWMQNHTIKAWKDQMDLSSKLIFQTADSNYLGRNVLTNLETGDILTHAANSPLTLVNNVGHDITNLQAFSNQWRVLSQEITSTPEAARGITPPSGTALGTVQIVTAQGLSLFEIMTENKGNALEQMLREYIIPHLKTKMNNKDEVAAILEDNHIQKLDAMFIPKAAVEIYNEKFRKAVLKGDTDVLPFDKLTEESNVRQELSSLGNQRFFSPEDVNWNEVLKDLEWKFDFGITNESYDKRVILETLSSTLQTIAGNPAILQDPNAKMLFNKILSFGNIVSPVELSTASAQPSPVALSTPSPIPIGKELLAK